MKSFGQLLVIWTLCRAANSGFAQTWTPTGASTNLAWQCIACSADGIRQVAAGNNIGIWVSTNSGSSWAITSAPTTNDWTAVASSADGTRLAAKDPYYGVICISADSGTTWTNANVPNWGWHTIAMSADGIKLAASAEDPSLTEYIFTSADAGATWVSNTVPGKHTVFIASSADGNRLVAASQFRGYTLISTNAGATWQTVASNVVGQSAASSASGSTLVLGDQGYILVSTDSGGTWTSNSTSTFTFGSGAIVSACASSADGTRLAAVAANNDVGLGGAVVLVSTNSGTTWTQSSAPTLMWTGVAFSADGFQLMASATYYRAPLGGISFGGIYRSQSTPAPCMNIMLQESSLTLSWTVPSMNFLLQQSPDLQNWADVTNQPVLNLDNLQNEVALPLLSGNLFYRLKTP